MAFHVRLATFHDYPAVAAIGEESQNLHAQAHPETFNQHTSGFTEEHIRALIQGEHTSVYVAEEDEHVVGYALLNIHPLVYFDIFKPQLIAEISDIAVSDALRGKGVGYLLFEAAKTWAKSKGAQRLELNVWEFNKDAQAFYERQGMRTLHRTMMLPLE